MAQVIKVILSILFPIRPQYVCPKYHSECYDG